MFWSIFFDALILIIAILAVGWLISRFLPHAGHRD